MATNNRKAGFSLIETVVAMAVLALVIVALASLLTKSLSLSQQSRDRAKAEKYLQTAMENLRYLRDQNNWTDFVDSSCGLVVIGSVPTPADSRFSQAINVTDVSSNNCADKAQIDVTVGWNNDQYSVNSSTYFTSWTDK
jgi:prepilin-type N-terminal cleavage/methylation domain-containing protein